MSIPTELWKNWEGSVVDGKFPLQRWLGGSNHSAVFLTGNGSGGSRKAIKLIREESGDDQLSRWAAAQKLSHPHLIRIFESGRFRVDDTKILYVVTEHAEENLAEIMPLRALSADEALEMLPPIAQALAFLHESGFVHGKIKPSNIMAVENRLKLSSDGIYRVGEHSVERAGSAYEAPEADISGLSPASDIWSLGVTLLAVLNQQEPNWNPGNRSRVGIPETMPPPLQDILRQCLQVDPQKRSTPNNILSQIQPGQIQTREIEPAKPVEVHKRQEPPKRWTGTAILVAALLLIAVVGGIALFRGRSSPAPETSPALIAPAAVPGGQSPPVPESAKPAPSGNAPGSVLQKVMPEVSRSAQNTITGHIKVSVQVAVDASGNVSHAKLVSAGPSKYFANKALAAAQGWKFNAPRVNGQPAASEWILRFQFARNSTQVFPAEMKR
jgi:TonB family protein